MMPSVEELGRLTDKQLKAMYVQALEELSVVLDEGSLGKCKGLNDFMELINKESAFRKDNNIQMGVVWPTPLAVSGITFRIKSMDEIVSDVVKIEREPDNKWDCYAIKVSVQDGDKWVHVGYVPKEMARNISDDVLPSRGKIIWRSTDEKGVGLRMLI